MANQNATNILPPTVISPSGYSNSPLVGKIQQLYDANNNNLYKKISPYTENSGLLSFGPRQPYVYVNPNQGRKGINGLKRFESRIFPIGSGLQDIQRIAQFLVTGNGILFLTKQFLLQKTQPFNETRIYNPLSAINAVVRPSTGFILPIPTRHLSGGLLGALSSLVGINVSSDKPIKGTAGEKNPDIIKKFEQNVHASRYGKGLTGLIRGGTAASAYYVKKPDNFGGLINFAKKLFGGTVNQPPGTKFRADESYSVFDLKAKKEFGSYTKDGVLDELHQRWYNDKDSSGAKMKDPGNEHRLKFPGSMANEYNTFADPEGTLNGESIGGELKAKYGDTVGPTDTSDSRYNLVPNSGPYSRSEIILIYKRYVERDDRGSRLYNKFPRDIRDAYGKGGTIILNQDGTYKNTVVIKSAPTVDGMYSRKIERYEPTKVPQSSHIEYYPINTPDETPLTQKRKELEQGDFSSTAPWAANSTTVALTNKLQSMLKKGGTPDKYGIYNVEKYVSDVNLTYGTLMARRKSPLDQKTLPEDGYQKRLKNKNIFALEDDRGKGLSGTGKSDYVNSLEILNQSDLDKTYNPYKNDFIAFYFHDLVNDRYIPFRATVKNINESATANWSDINYIGRADKLFNYTGFSRSLSFNFKVVSMSIKELLPMWKRINYLVGLTKPAKYTEGDGGYSNFIIPPLVKITIGDLYKEQPVVLKTVSISIPDDAIWEILPELNNEKNNWRYLNNKIEWTDSGGKYAQFPTECDIQISTELLETERPRTGGRNFGGGEENGEFSKQLIVK